MPGCRRMPGEAPGQVFDFVPFDPGYNHADGSREIGMAHGLYVDGVWRSEWYDTAGTGGRFVPAAPVFRNWITPDGSAGPSGTGGFPAERGRYHLYVSLACPYAHRTLIFRRLKKLEDVISMSVLDPVMGDEGWQCGDGPGTTPRLRQRRAPPRRDLYCSPTRATPGASRCRCSGTGNGGPSSTTSRPK